MAYQEPERQQFHFSSRKGWLNDPNGLCFYQGTYHLFYQHNPAAVHWGPMHWGHATGTDLIHWQEQPIALYPDESGVMFSGCAVVDEQNLTGLGVDPASPPLLFFYTCAGKPFTQNLAYSLDGGRTVVKYARNPVVPNLHGGEERDPSVAFDPASGTWRMALYLGDERGDFALLESADLLNWRETALFRIPNGGRECPELFQIADETDGKLRWAILEANGNYLVGDIADGRFQAEHAGVFMHRSGLKGGEAGQTFKNLPDGRRLYIAWQQDYIRGDAFSQSMTLPVELKLVGGELRVHPAAETRLLCAGEAQQFRDVSTVNADGELWELEFETPLHGVMLNIAGTDLWIDSAAGVLRSNAGEYPLPHTEKPLRWRAWLDRNTLELFESEGRFWLPLPIQRRPEPVISVPQGGPLAAVTLRPLQTIWR